MGNKPANSPKGQPPDADGHSSVSDLANSLTGDMVMVRWQAVDCVFHVFALDLRDLTVFTVPSFKHIRFKICFNLSYC